MSGFWKPGDEIVFRHVHDGEIRYAAPYRVVEDSTHRTVLYLPHFSVVYSISEGRLRPQQWRGSVLRIIEPEKWYSLLFFWSSDDERRPMHWYVNLELPAKRTPLGFDSRDLSLDVLITPDGSRATLKDVEEFEAATASGRCLLSTSSRLGPRPRKLSQTRVPAPESSLRDGRTGGRNTIWSPCRPMSGGTLRASLLQLLSHEPTTTPKKN